jgi:TonB family protein
MFVQSGRESSPRLCLFCLSLSLASAALAQTPSDAAQAIEKELGHRVMTLRALYRDDNLRFASDGSLIGHGETAFATSDAKFDLQHAELKGTKLILHGDLPVAMADGSDGGVTYHVGWVSRTVEIDLADTTSPGVMASLWKVFYQPSETIPGTCTTEEFLQRQAELKNKPAARDDDPLAFGERTPEKAVCRSNGDKIVTQFLRRHGPVNAPRATYDPEPEYPSKEKIEGVVVLQLVVDPKGHASSIIVVRSLGHGFDESAVRAVHRWKFDPATLEGEAVPVLVNVEVNFHKY